MKRTSEGEFNVTRALVIRGRLSKQGTKRQYWVHPFLQEKNGKNYTSKQLSFSFTYVIPETVETCTESNDEKTLLTE
jgi:hypothetical protein